MSRAVDRSVWRSRGAGRKSAIVALCAWGLAAAACGDPTTGGRVDATATADFATVDSTNAADSIDAAPDSATGISDTAAPLDTPADANAAASFEAAAGPDTADSALEGSDAALPECATATDCATLGSAGPCAHWTCTTAGTCLASADQVGTPCGAKAGCAQWFCGADGQCSVPKALPCPAGACQVGACDLAANVCLVQAAATATNCDDGNACTSGDTCDGKGSCAAGPALDCTATVCTTATCNPATGACVSAPIAATTTCDDGEPCTATDSCVAGQCQPGPWTCACKVSSDCDDDNPCTVATCATGACVVLALDATPCDDGSACTAGDGCAKGICLPGTATSCDDANACTADACVPATGACSHAGQNGPCDDGNPCTVSDACATSQCTAGAPPDCDDGNPCSDDACAPATGQCVHLPASAKACAQGKVCKAGTCACALGTFAVPTLGSEHVRSIASTPFGFVAVGDSVTSAGLRGLAVGVDLANTPVYIRRLGGNAATSFAAVVADSNGVRVALTGQLQHADLARLDGLGNLAKQVLVFQDAQAQALLALPDGGVLLLATDLWAPGASVRVARMSATDEVLWTTALPPPSADQVARAADFIVLSSSLWVAGQHHGFGAPQQTQPWLARLMLTNGQVLAVAPLPSLPTTAQVLATAVADNHLWLAGEGLAAPGNAWLARAALDSQGLPEAVTVVSTTPGPAAWSGLAALPDGVVAAGYHTGKGLDFTLRRQAVAGQAWALAPTDTDKQLLLGVAVLGDGSVVGVGGRAVKGGGEAVWLRVGPNGSVACQ